MREPSFQIEGQDGPRSDWVPYPVLFTTRDEAERSLAFLPATRPDGWPRYRVIEDTRGKD